VEAAAEGGAAAAVVSSDLRQKEWQGRQAGGCRRRQAAAWLPTHSADSTRRQARALAAASQCTDPACTHLRAAWPRRRCWASCVSEGLEEAAAAAVAARHRPLPLARLLGPVTACRPSWKGLRDRGQVGRLAVRADGRVGLPASQTTVGEVSPAWRLQSYRGGASPPRGTARAAAAGRGLHPQAQLSCCGKGLGRGSGLACRNPRFKLHNTSSVRQCARLQRGLKLTSRCQFVSTCFLCRPGWSGRLAIRLQLSLHQSHHFVCSSASADSAKALLFFRSLSSAQSGPGCQLQHANV
jgi:hypothetical protein